MITGHTTHTTSSCEAKGYCTFNVCSQKLGNGRIIMSIVVQSGRLGVRFMYAALGG